MLPSASEFFTWKKNRQAADASVPFRCGFLLILFVSVNMCLRWAPTSYKWEVITLQIALKKR